MFIDTNQSKLIILIKIKPLYCMYLINKKDNRIIKMQEGKFKDFNFNEREHLQEWIANEPSCLGEELLIIRKEFNGFDGTRERLDLLALDKEGNIVVIENKLDDSTKDVTWQALKYASYCSTLTKKQIIDIFQKYLDNKGDGENAEILLKIFFGKDLEELILNQELTQRIIFIAGKFWPEVTSTVLWLLNFNIRIQCYISKLFSLDEQLFLTFERIIPIKDSEALVIKIAEKNQEDAKIYENSNNRNTNFEFWTTLLKKLSEKSTLFSTINPSKESWISTGAGKTNVSYTLMITREYASVEVSLIGQQKEENKRIFDALYQNKNQIEKTFGNELEWRLNEDKKQSKITYVLSEVNKFNKDDWDRMMNFLIENIIKLEKAFRDPISKIDKYLIE